MAETKRDFNEDKRICSAATAGPWYTGDGYEQSDRGNYVASKMDGRIVCAEEDFSDCVLETKDATFIAEARTGWPAALDEIERLRSALERICSATLSQYVDAQNMAVALKRMAFEATETNHPEYFAEPMGHEFGGPEDGYDKEAAENGA